MSSLSPVRWLFRAFLLLVGLAELLFAIGGLLPKEVHVSRSREVRASPQEVHALVSSSAGLLRWAGPGPGVSVEVLPGPEQGAGVALRYDDASGTSWYRLVEVGEDRVSTWLDQPDLGARIHANLVLEPVEVGTRVTWNSQLIYAINPLEQWLLFLFGTASMEHSVDESLGRLAAAAEA